MNRTRILVLILVAVALAAAGFVGYTIGRENAPHSGSAFEGGKADEEEPPVATVQTAVAAQAPLNITVAAYGTVIASPEDTHNVSAPFETRVRRVLVTTGQHVESQTPLVEIEPTPAALLELQDARSAKEAAAKDLQQVQQRLDMKLATKSELLTAEQALKLAQSKLDSLEKQQIAPRRLTAGMTGLVSKVDVQEGQVIAAGGPLAEVVPSNRVQVRLGVEPRDVPQLRVGQAVELMPVEHAGSQAVQGKVAIITQRVNPASRLVDVFVALPDKSPLMLETYVRGLVITDTKQALVVPHAAVLPEEDKQIVYTVKDAKAVKREVRVGLDDGTHAEILEGIKAGETVVTQGNYELEDGMAVEVETEHKP